MTPEDLPVEKTVTNATPSGPQGGGTFINPDTHPPKDPYVLAMEEGGALQRTGEMDLAIEAFRRAVVINPHRLDAFYCLAVALQHKGDTVQATHYLEKCIQIDKNHPDPYNMLGSISWTLKKGQEALKWFKKALDVHPTFDKSWYNIGIVASSIGDVEQAREAHLRAVSLNPQYFDSWQALIFLRDVTEDSEECWRERRRLWSAVGPAVHRTHANTPDPDRRLRIGYVSGDFWLHSACFIFGGLILNHDWDFFHPVCYMVAPKNDFLTEQMRDHTIWRFVPHLDHTALADLIQRDRIDILVDLSAFSFQTRLPVFRMKPAPIQVTAWGHAMGTGMEEMDYIFHDPISAPPDTREQFTESVWDLPSLMCYNPPMDVVPVGPLPALTNGHVTFASFNRIMKLTTESWQRWGEILRRVPKSRLIVKCIQFDVPDAVDLVRSRITTEFNIDTNRVFIRGTESHPRHMASYGEADLGLDPWPHGGGVTTVESLFNGVPVICQAGRWVAARTGVSLLTNAGIPEFATTSRQDYIDTAVRWANDLDGLARIRAGLREAMVKSPICDIPGYTRAVERGYREMWRRWCAGRPDHAGT